MRSGLTTPRSCVTETGPAGPTDAVYALNSGGPEPVPGKAPSKQKLFSQLCGPSWEILPLQKSFGKTAKHSASSAHRGTADPKMENLLVHTV